MKILENLNPNQLVLLIVKLKCPLRDYENLRNLAVFNSSWEEVFIQVPKEVFALAEIATWAARESKVTLLLRTTQGRLLVSEGPRG